MLSTDLETSWITNASSEMICSSQFASLFINDIPMIDTRSPGEFKKGAFATSVNLPLMTDEERTQVGTCYKHEGKEAAISLGHSIVKDEIKEARVSAWSHFIEQYPHAVLYCWRGGLRSQICQGWLQESSHKIPRIEGGYKALRQFLIEQQKAICSTNDFIIVAGKTGSNKTGLIQQAGNAVDLESLANHQGSSFGKRPEGQPTQLQFENLLAIDLLKCANSSDGKSSSIIFEDEGRMIGRCALPLDIKNIIEKSPIVLLDISLDERTWHSYENYILGKLLLWTKRLGEEEGFIEFSKDLKDSLFRVRKRLGLELYQQLNQQLIAALEEHKKGRPESHLGWISALLTQYYDPLYDYQMQKSPRKVLMTGDFKQALDYVKS